MGDEYLLKESPWAEERALRDENARLHAALKKYGQHKKGCEPLWGAWTCSCGLVAAAAPVAPEEPEP